jgi:hypothetical protein
MITSTTISNIASHQTLYFPQSHQDHYAMHNAELMKFWGPLPLLSEFPYEQHNGALQKIKANWHICKKNLTLVYYILILVLHRGNGFHYVAPDLPTWPIVWIHTKIHQYKQCIQCYIEDPVFWLSYYTK